MISLFKAFTQGDKKYVTIRIFKKLFCSQVWRTVKPFLFISIFALYLYCKDASLISFEDLLATYAVICVWQLLVAYAYRMFDTPYDPFLLKSERDFVVSYDQSFMQNFVEFSMMFWICFFPSYCNILCRFNLCCKDKLMLLHVTGFESDDRFCYLSLFCYRAEGSKKNIDSRV